MSSSKTRPVSFYEQWEPDFCSEIESRGHVPHPKPTAGHELDVDRGRLLAIQAERDRVRRRRLAPEQGERREAERHTPAERHSLARADQRRAREDRDRLLAIQAERDLLRRRRLAREQGERREAERQHRLARADQRRAREENTLRRQDQQAAPGPDRAKANAPPVVAEESEFGILNRQAQQLVLPRGRLRGLENGRVGDKRV